MTISTSISCDVCGSSSPIEREAIVAAAQIATFVAAHSGHDRVAVEFVLIAPTPKASAPAA